MPVTPPLYALVLIPLFFPPLGATLESCEQTRDVSVDISVFPCMSSDNRTPLNILMIFIPMSKFKLFSWHDACLMANLFLNVMNSKTQPCFEVNFE